MAGTKYNPTLSSMVGNFRHLAKEVGIDLTGLSDEQVWKVIDETELTDPAEHEAHFLDTMREHYPDRCAPTKKAATDHLLVPGTTATHGSVGTLMADLHDAYAMTAAVIDDRGSYASASFEVQYLEPDAVAAGLVATGAVGHLTGGHGAEIVSMAPHGDGLTVALRAPGWYGVALVRRVR